MSELIPYTIKDTGTHILIRRVSPLLVMELRKAFPEPKPPMQEVDVGGETRLEANYAHPDYQATLAEYNDAMELRIRRLMLKRGVVIPEDNTTWRQELADMRKFWLDEFGVELPVLDKDEQVDWLSYCAFGTDSDFSELYAAILQRSQPTPEAVDAAKAGFPPEV